jgi:hypothetical protein
MATPASHPSHSRAIRHRDLNDPERRTPHHRHLPRSVLGRIRADLVRMPVSVRGCVSGEHRETRGRYSVGHETRVEGYRRVEMKAAAGQHGVGTAWFKRQCSESKTRMMIWRDWDAREQCNPKRAHSEASTPHSPRQVDQTPCHLDQSPLPIGPVFPHVLHRAAGACHSHRERKPVVKVLRPGTCLWTMCVVCDGRMIQDGGAAWNVKASR